MNSYGYGIPEQYHSCLSNAFCHLMAVELQSIFHNSNLFDGNSYGELNIDFLPSTQGWATAFEYVCTILDENELLEYYKGLEWYETDCFDEIICEKIKEYYNYV